ncbi:MAG: AAA family ATPase [Pseudomonadota bacterium]
MITAAAQPSLDPVSEFLGFLHAQGPLAPAGDVAIAPGRIVRYRRQDDRAGKRNGACKLANDGMVGWVWDWKGGSAITWRPDRATSFSPGARAKVQQQIETDRAAREQREAKAAALAQRIWDAAEARRDRHPYLESKGLNLKVRHCPVRRWVGGVQVEGAMLVPLRDDEGRVRNLQFITADGKKRFLSGGRVAGLWYPMGRPEGETPTIVLAEGAATAASIHICTSLPVAAAFNCTNLEAVALKLREKFPNARIVLAADNDTKTAGNPGITAATRAASAVGGLVAIPEISGDFNDVHVQAGAEAVKRAIANARPPRPSTKTKADSRPASRIVVVTAHELLARELPIREAILAPWLLSQSLSMIYARRGVGKTHVALGIAYAVAAGGEFLGWAAERPRGVLYVDGEMPAIALQERLALLAASSGKEPDPALFRIVTPDLQQDFRPVPDLSTPGGQAELDEAIDERTELIVLDNLSCLVRSGGRENEAEGWRAVQDWALAKRAQGKSVLFIHHAGKGGDQRGTSKREDVLDSVICLKQPADYEPRHGAWFQVHFEKARNLRGNEADPFEARLEETPDGRQRWTVQSVQASNLERIVALKADGLTQTEIAAELGINKSTVSRTLRRARDEGLIADEEGGK